MEPSLDFLVDNLRITIPIPFSPLVQSFVSKKGTEINRVSLNMMPIDLVKELLRLTKYEPYVDHLDDLTQDGVDVSQDHGYYGYNRTVEVGLIKFMYVDDDTMFKTEYDGDDADLMTIEPLAKMGVCIDIGGSACRQLESHLDKYHMSILDWLERLLYRYPDMKVARVDLTMDFLKKMPGVTPLAVYRQFIHGDIKCVTHAWDYNDSGDDRDGSHGATLYIGKRTADFMIRIYDKQKERYYQHGDLWLNPHGFKIRWEQEIKHDLALEVVKKAIEYKDGMLGFYRVYLDLLMSKMWVYPNSVQLKNGNYEEVIPVTSKAKRPRKKPMAKWYYDLLQPVDRKLIQLHNPAPYKTGADLVAVNYVGALFEKMQIHIMHGGDPLKLMAHWIQQGKLKRNDDNYQALIEKLKSVKYDPSLIDDKMTTAQAYKILHREANYHDFDVEKRGRER